MKSYPPEIHELVKELYTVVTSDDQWPSVINLIGEYFRSRAAGLFLQHPDGTLGKVMIPGIPISMASVYEERYGAINPWFTTPGLMQPGAILSDATFHEQLGFKKNYFFETEFYQDWFKPQCFKHTVGGQLISIEGSFLNFTLIRDQAERQFNAKELEEYRVLSQHIFQALNLAQSVNYLHETLSANAKAFELMGKGFAIISEGGVVNHVNAMFAPLLGPHGVINENNKNIEFRAPSMENSFYSSIRRCMKFSTPITTNILDGANTLNMQFIPPQGVDNIFNEGSRFITLILSSNKGLVQGAETFRLLNYPLTEREIEILKIIVNGGTSKKASEQLNITYETARWHLKNIMQKVGARTQNELIYRINQAIDKLPKFNLDDGNK